MGRRRSGRMGLGGPVSRVEYIVLRRSAHRSASRVACAATGEEESGCGGGRAHAVAGWSVVGKDEGRRSEGGTGAGDGAAATAAAAAAFMRGDCLLQWQRWRRWRERQRL